MGVPTSLVFLLVPPFMDLDVPTGFPSIFSRAYHTHLSQHTSDFDPLTSSFSSSPIPSCTLPQFHPLLVRHADHPQQQAIARSNSTAAATSTATASGSNSNSAGLSFENITPSAEAAAVAMQQVLTNISAASGGSEAGGGRGATETSASGSQRTRGVFSTDTCMYMCAHMHVITRQKLVKVDVHLQLGGGTLCCPRQDSTPCVPEFLSCTLVHVYPCYVHVYTCTCMMFMYIQCL